MSWQFNDQQLLSTHFSFLKISTDIQRLILDYLYQRSIKIIIKNDIKHWVRFGPTIISDKCAYEIRVYNENESHIISTFALKDENLAIEVLNHFTNTFDKHNINDYLYDDHVGDKARYAFSPFDNSTYSPYTRHLVFIMIYKVGGRAASYDAGKYHPPDVAHHAKIINGYCRLIEQYGDDWDKYPWFRDVIKYSSDNPHVYLPHAYRHHAY